MPIRKVKGGYKWGKALKKPVTKERAKQIQRAAYANGYRQKALKK